MEYQLQKHLAIILNAPTISCIVCKTFKRNLNLEIERLRLDWNLINQKKENQSQV